MNRPLLVTSGAVLLLAPCLLTAWLAFSPDPFFTLPIQAWSTRWFIALAGDPQWRLALPRSLCLALASGLMAVGLGLPAAIALARSPSRWILPALVLPGCLPPVAWGLGLMPVVAGLEPLARLGVLVVADALLGLPVVLLVLRLRVDKTLFGLLETARGLGASPFQAWIRIGLPQVLPSLMVGWLLAATLALHEPVLCLFLCPAEWETLPALAWPTLRSSLTPVVAAAATVTTCLGLVFCGLAWCSWHRR